MSTIPIKKYTAAEYLALERASGAKHELHDGFLIAMAGASESHNLISGNVLGELRNAVREKGCRVYPGDMRIRIPRTGYYFYPDVSIVCGEPEFDDAERDALLNPLVVIEVLSASTERFDRGEKFRRYRRISTLRDYVLISQDQPFVEVHSRRDFNRWELTEFEGVEGNILLPALGVSLQPTDIYEFVKFDGASPPGAHRQ